jgi:uncharacterized protein YcbK (DUF882 family)
MRPRTRFLLLLISLLFFPGEGSAKDGAVVLVHARTRETLEVRPGRLASPARINRFLRCAKDRKYTLMDPRLIAAAVSAARRFDKRRVLVLSAFRTSRLNKALRAEGRNVALRSRHINGQALDLRIGGTKTRDLCRYFVSLELGGVGCYERARFVHIDVGPVRYWER